MALVPIVCTANVENGSDLVEVSGTDASAGAAVVLTDINCRPNATVFLGGVGYLVAERMDTTSLRIERNYAGADASGVSCTIAPFTPEMANRAELATNLRTYSALTSLLQARGNGLHYVALGATGSGDPGAGQVSYVGASWASATALCIDVLDAVGRSRAGLIDRWANGDTLIVESIATAAYVAYELTEPPSEQGSGAWYLLEEFALVASDGALVDGEALRLVWLPVGAGEPGASAYDIAVANGFVGDETAWLASLAGDDGVDGTNGVDGKFSGTETMKTAAYTATAADVGKTIILNKATTDALSFEPAATLGATWMAIIKNIGAGTWTLDPYGAETIDGAATVSLATNQSLVVGSNGTALRTMFLSSASAGVLSKTANYTVAAADKGALILCDATSAAFTVTLPAAAAAGAGFEIAVKKTDSSINTVTIDGDGSETIDGATTFVLDEQYEEVTIRSDGAGWAVVAYHAARARNSREVLSANRTYYVRTDGNNNNSGLANTSGGAFLTSAKALSVALSLDLNGYDCILQHAAGTHTTSLNMTSAQVGAGRIILRGDTTTPANVVISTAGNSLNANAPGARLFFEGVKLTSSGASCIMASNGAIIKALGSFELGAAAVYHVRSLVDALVDFESVNHAITGAALRAYSAEEGGKVKLYNCAVTLSGTLGFTTFAHAEIMGIIQAGLASFTGGTITGKRYDVYTNAVVNAGGGGTSLFPGNTAGTVDSNGGRYVA